jgi:phage shock protein A
VKLKEREGACLMANVPADMIVPMLREMRSEMNDRFNQMDNRFGQLEQRLDEVEDELKSVRKMLVADTLMSKLLTGDFEKRISVLETDVQRLMKDA